jgi:hypothetical protein
VCVCVCVRARAVAFPRRSFGVRERTLSSVTTRTDSPCVWGGGGGCVCLVFGGDYVR